MKKRDVILTTEAHRPAFERFYEAMSEIERHEGWRSYEVLRKFLEAGFLAVRGRMLTGEAFDKNEADYMAIVKACRRPETMSKLAEMLGALGMALTVEPVDFIGPVFTQVAADKQMGQCFTPHHVSYFMAKMIMGDVVETLKDRPYITLSEPACGVGGMVLAANLALREQGIDVARQAHWHMVEINHPTMCAAYLQVSMTDTSAIVDCGNALSLETWSRTPTPAAWMFPKTFSSAAPTPVTQNESAAALPAPAGPSNQLELF